MGSDMIMAALAEVHDVSIHTPTWGVTSSALAVASAVLCFNPHSHMGSDAQLLSSSITVSVSIHTPTWGVTGVPAHDGERVLFQSTLPHGE